MNTKLITEIDQHCLGLVAAYEGDASSAVDNDDAYGKQNQNKQNKMADIVSSGTTEEARGEGIAGEG